MSSTSNSQIDLVVAASTRWRASEMAGDTVYIYHNDLTGAYYATDPITHGFLQELSSGCTVAEALAASPAAQGQVLKTLPVLLEAGILETGRGSPEVSAGSKNVKPKPPLESRLAFAKIELLEIGWVYWQSTPLTRWLFSRTGIVLFVCLGLLALNSILSNTDTLVANFSRIDPLSPSTLLTLTIVLLLLKAIHEVGHALAMAHFMEAEGERVPPIRAGVVLFFLLPLPFTNTTASWSLKSKWRRAAIGMAGMYLETWVAFVATLLWASVGESELQQALLQVMIVSGVSTLLFNLNPLIRLDGYYVLTDVFDQPNLATRANSVARQVGHFLLGASPPVSSRQYPLIGYWAASLGYRCITMSMIAYAAFLFDERLGTLVVGLGLMILFIRPLITTLTSSLKAAPERAISVHLRIAAATVILVTIPFIQIADPLILKGQVDFEHQQRITYSEAAGRVDVADEQETTKPGTILYTIENPELRYWREIANNEYELARLSYREAAIDGPEELMAKSKALAAAKHKLTEAERKVNELRFIAVAQSRWIAEKKRYWHGAWIDPSNRQSLGTLIENGPPRLVAMLDQGEAENASKQVLQLQGLVRFNSNDQRLFPVKVASITATAQNQTAGAAQPSNLSGAFATKSFEIGLVLTETVLPRAFWLHGKQFYARLERPPRALGLIYWTKLERLIQKTFRIRETT